MAVGDRPVKLLGVDWASEGLPGDAWTLATPPDRVVSLEWLRGDPASHRVVVVIQRNGASADATAVRAYATAVLRAREVVS
jgi:hypothetical protein